MTNYPIKIHRRGRTRMTLRIFPDCIEVTIPSWMEEDHPDVQAFIDKTMARMKDRIKSPPEPKVTLDDIRQMVQAYAKRMKLQPKRVSFRQLSSRWGSCSSNNNVSLNKRLVYLPRPIVEYVVCHELAHLKELNHSPAFWAIVAKHMPDYKKRRAELRRLEKNFFS